MKLTLKDARELARLSQKQVAKEIGVHINSISNYERGVIYPRCDILQKMVNLYRQRGVSIPHVDDIFLS